ncbi:hypothetical protein HD597_001350 [Nonomuraea thailandensis]|uniref:LPXTG cell wall anchor domain-containing protein n=1 Tax=Nonomuraea thailandensis TaxID=1188745 RepID=A0A9X2GAV0_9ACTN|nr:hypothetical protein [Nonomuraea thailandensis]MCP2354330.1 hypothetical protein [Nonomuraea thailandensis]
MARARRLAAAGAATAFVVAGTSLAAGLAGPAWAGTDPQVPGAESTCMVHLPLLCDEPADESWSGDAEPGDSWSSAPGHSEAPQPHDSWSNAPEPHESGPDAPKPNESWSNAPVPTDSWPAGAEPPWRPAGEDEHRVPEGHPETGGGGLAAGGPLWPFAVGGVALLTGAGLTGFAVRRRRDVV